MHVAYTTMRGKNNTSHASHATHATHTAPPHFTSFPGFNVRPFIKHTFAKTPLLYSTTRSMARIGWESMWFVEDLLQQGQVGAPAAAVVFSYASTPAYVCFAVVQCPVANVTAQSDCVRQGPQEYE